MEILMTLCVRRLSSKFYNSYKSTVYALASGGIPSALGVIRVSGPNCSQVLKKLGRFESLPSPRCATLRRLYDPITENIIDHSIIIWFPGPKSYTGEDSCEFHVHGGVSVISGLLKALGTFPDVRMAEAGEFTKRAFLNGKMDLTEVDALGDLIAAETEMQRIQALKQMNGALSRVYVQWRNSLAKSLANCEAHIDFGEDEELNLDMTVVANDIKALKEEIQVHLKDRERGEKLRNGLRVAIIGKPNVGKSTLLNYLCQRDAAIVSNIPGTTRDVIEGCVNLNGFPVIFVDTAGIRSKTTDEIELQGIQRSLKELKESDLVILLVDSQHLDQFRLERDPWTIKKSLLQEMGIIDELDVIIRKCITVLNKVDLIHTTESQELTFDFDSEISLKSNIGIDEFHKRLQLEIKDRCGDPTRDIAPVTRERYRSELESCINYLNDFLNFQGEDLALRIDNLRSAIHCLGSITGHVTSEQVFDIIFRDFCIGK